MSYDYDWCGHTADTPDARPCGAPIERWSSEWKHRSRDLDVDHKAVVQPPVGDVDEGLHLRASRYAEALAAAAAADARVAALTESQLRQVEENPHYGTVWPQTGPEPDEHVAALLCLTTGQVFRRRGQWSPGWERAEVNPTTATCHQWPIADAGPFIVWNDGYGFDLVLRESRKVITEFDALHRKLYGEPGYRAEGASQWGRPRLAEAIDRILLERSHRRQIEAERAGIAERKLAQLRRSIEHLVPDDTQQWPVKEAFSGDEVRAVEVIDLEKVHALLDRKDCGGEVL